jgi:hypothetical protein
MSLPVARSAVDEDACSVGLPLQAESERNMSDRVTVMVSHHLGKAEAVRRLKEGFAQTKGQLGGMITIEQETWEGDTLRFAMRALGQTASGTVDVLEDALRIEVALPWLLAKAANRLLPILRKQATLLIEKK